MEYKRIEHTDLRNDHKAFSKTDHVACPATEVNKWVEQEIAAIKAEADKEIVTK